MLIDEVSAHTFAVTSDLTSENGVLSDAKGVVYTVSDTSKAAMVKEYTDTYARTETVQSAVTGDYALYR